MFKSPKVSILIPVYKVPEIFLRKSINSAINQTLKEIEIIIVDDGSPDNCGKIIDQYACKDSRVKVVHQKNKGLSSARNSAFYEAKGEYITFLDGDDYLELNACEIAYNTAKTKNVQMVFWNQYTEYAHSTTLVKSMGDGDKFFGEKECRELQNQVLNFGGKIAQVFSKLINREFLISNNIRHIDELRQGAEGIVFNFLMFSRLKTAYYLDMPLLHYRYNENSISHSYSEQNHYLTVRCFEYIEKILIDENRKEMLVKLYNRFLYVVITVAISGYFNPNNQLSYREKKQRFKHFLNNNFVNKVLREKKIRKISISRRCILVCIDLKQFWVINILAKLRRYQMFKCK